MAAHMLFPNAAHLLVIDVAFLQIHPGKDVLRSGI